MNGKGDNPRPLSVDEQTFADNWERTFGPEQLELPLNKPRRPTEADVRRDLNSNPTFYENGI